MTEDEGRVAVVAEALHWLGTPWHHAARSRGAGVDCAQFLIGVYVGAGLIDGFETGTYPRDWHIHRGEERFLPIVKRFTSEIAEAEAKPADIVLFKIGRVYSHAAIIVRWPQVIHAWIAARSVVLGDIDRDIGMVDVSKRYFTFQGW